MHEYAFDIETVRLAVILGVIFSMLFYERLHLTTGGAIVPGYLAVFLPRPLFIVITIATAYLTYYFVNRVLARRYILYGRRKVEAEILVSLLLVSLWSVAAYYGMRWSARMVVLFGVGFIIPGILAHDMNRQGPHKTTLAVLMNTAVVGVVIFIYHSLIRIAPWYRRAEVPDFEKAGLGYPLDLLLPAVIVSVIVGVAVFRYLHLRTGGFIMGAYWALVLLRPLDVLFALLVGIATYLFVTRVLMRQMLLFGRRKMSMMVLVGAIFAWSAELLLQQSTGGAYVPWSGFHVITLFVPALFANDAQRQGLYRTVWGTAVTAVAVFSLMNLADAGRRALGYSPAHLAQVHRAAGAAP